KADGRALSNFDLLVAAPARTHDLTLATLNIRHFQRLPNLSVEDWTQMKRQGTFTGLVQLLIALTLRARFASQRLPTSSLTCSDDHESTPDHVSDQRP